MFLSAYNISCAVEGIILTNNLDANNNFAKNVIIDSREAKKNVLFCPIKGNKIDAHIYIPQVIKNGVNIVLTQKLLDNETLKIAEKYKATIIKVDSCITALQTLATYWLSVSNKKVIGITGSCGKTTSRNLIYDVLKTKYKCCVTKKNFNNEIGLPITVCNSKVEDEILILEMGMYNIGDINLLCKISNPYCGLITNIGDSHVERLGSRENIARAKSELAENVTKNKGWMFLPASDDYLNFIINKCKNISRNANIVLYGDSFLNIDYKYSQIWADDIVFNKKAQPYFSVHYFNNKNNSNIVQRCCLNMQGEHNIKNALGACAVGLHFDISLEQCCMALEESKPEEGRQQCIKSKKYGFEIINDAYNASPQSMMASINMFDKLKINNKKVLVLGDMAELGYITKKAHNNIGEYVSKLNFEKLICVGKYSKFIYDNAINNGMNKNNVFYFKNNNETYNFIKKYIDKNCTILFKASNCMNFEDMINKLK